MDFSDFSRQENLPRLGGGVPYVTIRKVALDLTIEGTFFVKGPGPGTGPAHPGLPTCSNLFNLDFTVQDPLPDMFKGVLPPRGLHPGGVCLQGVWADPAARYMGYYGIRSTSGRYASYCNDLLLLAR